MISLAFWATVINYMDRHALSVVAPVLRDQFHLSNVVYSRVLFAFLLAYTIMNGASGPIIDRAGTRLGYALCMAWWSAAAVLHRLARGGARAPCDHAEDQRRLRAQCQPDTDLRPVGGHHVRQHVV